MQGEIARTKRILEDYIPDPECERVARRIVQEIAEEQKKKKEIECRLIDRFGPGGDLWHPCMR